MNKLEAKCTITVYSPHEMIQSEQYIEVEFAKEKYIDKEKIVRTALQSASNISIEQMIETIKRTL